MQFWKKREHFIVRLIGLAVYVTRFAGHQVKSYLTLSWLSTLLGAAWMISATGLAAITWSTRQ
jgi:hypothetical protein